MKRLTIGSTVVGVDHMPRARAFWMAALDYVPGLRLGELLAAAGLEVLDHRGRLTMVTRGPGWRPVAWAAREEMVAAGFANAADLARWESALTELDRAPLRLTSTMATFLAVGRRPS